MTRNEHSGSFTSLEKEILRRLRDRYDACGFPDLADLTFLERESTSAYRYTRLEVTKDIDLPSEDIGLGTYSHIAMKGLPSGMLLNVEMGPGRKILIQLIVNGPYSWDGTERPWSIIEEGSDEYPTFK